MALKSSGSKEKQKNHLHGWEERGQGLKRAINYKLAGLAFFAAA